MSPHSSIALLRGINVSGRNRIPMDELRALCTELGWSDVRSYIQSGNLVFRADGSKVDPEAELEQAMEERFGLSVPVIVRSAERWLAYAAENPFPEASEREPSLVMLALSKAPPEPDALGRLRGRAGSGEWVEQVGNALWIHYAAGVGRSKLTPGLLDRVVGSPVTTRNWRTVVAIDGIARPSTLP